MTPTPAPDNPTDRQIRAANYVVAMVAELTERAEPALVPTASGKHWPAITVMRDDGLAMVFPIPAMEDD